MSRLLNFYAEDVIIDLCKEGANIGKLAFNLEVG
jgi:hypothetical protein